jgi:hypothetical protein
MVSSWRNRNNYNTDLIHLELGVAAGTSATPMDHYGTCTSSSDVILTNNAPTTAIAGSNQSQCNTSSFIPFLNAPTIGTGSWSVVGGHLQHTITLTHLELLRVLRRV